MTSCGEPLVELAECETPVQAASAFLNCLRTDSSLAQALVYVVDRETGELLLYASTKDDRVSERDSAQRLDSTALEAVESGEDRHVFVEDVAADSPFRQLLDLGNEDPRSVLKCCPVCGRTQKGRVVALFVMLCHHPPDSNATGPAIAPMSTLKGLLAVAVKRTEVAMRHRKDLASVKENSQSEVALWNDFYHLFEYRHDSMELTMELCRIVEKMTGGITAVCLVNEISNNLLVQVCGLKVPREDIVIQIESTPYGAVVEANTTCIVDNLDQYSNERLLLDQRGVRPTSMMCAAISAKYEDGSREKVALMVVSSYDFHRFTEKDLLTFTWLIEHATPLYLGVLLNDSLTLAKLQNETLLQVAGHLFAHLDDMSQLLKEILTHARLLIGAEKCSLFLLEKNENCTEELVAVIFDNEIVGDKPRRLTLAQGIAGSVATSGDISNIPDVHAESSFCEDVDTVTGFRTRNILCFPIKGKNGSILGVAQLVNKIGGKNFSYIDEELAKSFAVYCGISICHSLLYMRAKEAQNRSRLATELMMYHMQTLNEEDVTKLAQLPAKIPDNVRQPISSFEFSHKPFPGMETMQLLVGMFEEMGLLTRWRIPKVALCRFVLTVKRGYRHPPYHNWDHAFSVAHFCYCLWKRCGHLHPLSDMEVLGLFVASLCHDIDHRGTNNAFQVNAHSVLAALYSSEGSVMEHHHFAQTMCILNTENCNIFVNLDAQEYQQVLDIMYEVILDTDIAVHLKKVKDMERMAEDGVDANNPKHRHLLLSLLMTSCDLNSSTKPWPEAQESARKIYMEFFTQGDLEKVLELQSQEMMDRNHACIPEQQISFTDFIAMPVFKILHKVFPTTCNVLARLKANYDTWAKVKQMYWDQASTTSTTSGSGGSPHASAKSSRTRSFDQVMVDTTPATCSSRRASLDSSGGEDEASPSVAAKSKTTSRRVPRKMPARFDSTSSIGSAGSLSSSESSSYGLRSVSIGSVGSGMSLQLKSETASLIDATATTPVPIAQDKGVLAEAAAAPRQRASTGQLPSRHHIRLRVYETYLSRRASHLIGAEYTLQAAQLQAGLEAAPDVAARPSLHHRRPGQFEAPRTVDRVTDPVQNRLVEQATRLQRSARYHYDSGSEIDAAGTASSRRQQQEQQQKLKPTFVLDGADTDGLLATRSVDSDSSFLPQSAVDAFGDISLYPVSPECRTPTPMLSRPRFERDTMLGVTPIRPLRHSADDAMSVPEATTTKAKRNSDGGPHKPLQRSASDMRLGNVYRRKPGMFRASPAPGDELVARRRRGSQGTTVTGIDSGLFK